MISPSQNSKNCKLKDFDYFFYQKENTQPQGLVINSEDEAAGLRKQLLRFHCISCDRPIDVATTNG